jgi:hypothetical protein
VGFCYIFIVSFEASLGELARTSNKGVFAAMLALNFGLLTAAFLAQL